MHRILAPCVLSIAVISSGAQAQNSPYCPADLVYDNALNFFDISAFIKLYQLGDLTVDYNNTGDLNFFDISLFLQMITGDCPDLTDTDGDRLPDFVETDNGIYIDHFATGSDPLIADTDGDGLFDGDEVLGTTSGLVLPGASPVFKDVFVECDWFAGVFEGRNEDYRPTPAVDARVSNAFFVSSTPNPYGLPDGINIHLDYGQGNGFEGGNQLPGTPFFVLFDDEFNAYKADHFDPRRKGYYHYAIFGNRYNTFSNRSSGIAEINGDDFMVTLVDYNSTNNMSNTILHELGHNLGLRHGGFENRNRKPNYNSVMNYRHQFPGVDISGNALGDGVLDYSHGVNMDIDENSINELQGVNGTFPIDWNHNGVLEPIPYALNINCNSNSSTAACGSGSGCYDSICGVLEDHDDWNNISWDRLGASSDRVPELMIIECENWPGKY